LLNENARAFIFLTTSHHIRLLEDSSVGESQDNSDFAGGGDNNSIHQDLQDFDNDESQA